ncbi:MAG: hypothetical protein AAFZ07_29505, partial [Actinomycetota bacterium]
RKLGAALEGHVDRSATRGRETARADPGHLAGARADVARKVLAGLQHGRVVHAASLELQQRRGRQAAAAGAARADEAARARLTIGDDLYRVPIGKPFAVMVDGERVTMKIEVDQTKAFAEAGVGFRYPAEFKTRRDDGDENVAVWTLEGRSAAIVVQKYRDTLDAESLAEAIAATIVERYGEERVERTSVKLRGADRAYDGERLTIAAAPGARLPTETEQNLFAFENERGVFT